ncbi:hypothetical protein HDU87_002689 [Geranomyces variabilis]|uniref:Uncharacterized protein n=1 Tax=Geranomyces variabilis TaxID=109894 RepID=A0AAD5TRF9_9FUNG|nr:hypothetical protein HDU87_002689 [Geranomyces variabilis]
MKRAAKLAKRLQRKEAASAGTSPEPYRPAQYGRENPGARAAHPAMMTAGPRHMHTQSGSQNMNLRNQTAFDAPPPGADYDGGQYQEDEFYYHDRGGDSNLQHDPPQSARYARGRAPTHQQQFNRQSNSQHPHSSWQPPHQPQYQRESNSHYAGPYGSSWQPQYYLHPSRHYPPFAPHGIWYPPPQEPIPPLQRHYNEPMAHPRNANMQYPQARRPPGRQPQITQLEDQNDHGIGEND